MGTTSETIRAHRNELVPEPPKRCADSVGEVSRWNAHLDSARMSVAPENPLVCSLANWVDDQLDRLIHLTEAIPEGWRAKVPPLPLWFWPQR